MAFSPRHAAMFMAIPIALAGCSGTPDEQAAPGAPSEGDLRQALQTYFDKNPECAPFFEVPAEVRIEPSSYRISQLDAFAAAGLLRRSGEIVKPHEVTGAPERYARYEATPLGQQSIRSGEGSPLGSRTLICYGRRKVDTVTSGGIDEITPDRLSVKYSYRLVDIPAWTRAPSITQFYPGLAKRLDGTPGSDGETLQRVNTVWTLPKQTAFGPFDFRQESH